MLIKINTKWGSLNSFSSYKHLRLILRVFLTGDTAAMVTCNVMKTGEYSLPPVGCGLFISFCKVNFEIRRKLLPKLERLGGGKRNVAENGWIKKAKGKNKTEKNWWSMLSERAYVTTVHSAVLVIHYLKRPNCILTVHTSCSFISIFILNPMTNYSGLSITIR